MTTIEKAPPYITGKTPTEVVSKEQAGFRELPVSRLRRIAGWVRQHAGRLILATAIAGATPPAINAGADFLNSVGQAQQDEREIGTGGQSPEQTIITNRMILSTDRKHRISGQTWEIDLERINIRPNPEVNDKPSDDSIPANGSSVTELNGLPVNPRDHKVVVTFPIMTQGEGTQGTLSEASWIEVTYKTITNGQERIGFIAADERTAPHVKPKKGDELIISYIEQPPGNFNVTADGEEMDIENIGVTSTVAKQE